MSEHVAEIVMRHQARATMGGRASKLEAVEVQAIHAWIRMQRLADEPDEVNWKPLMTCDAPFYHQAFKTVIHGDEGRLVMECVLPLKKNEDLPSIFPKLQDQGIRFVFSALQRAQIGIFPATLPLLIDLTRPAFLWAVHTKNEDSIAVKPAIASDILSVLLRTWKDHRAHQNLARERICDILSKCLTF